VQIFSYQTEFLRHIPLFSSLNEEQLSSIIGMLQPRPVVEGEILFWEGEPGDRFYVILTGQLEIIKAIGSEHEHLIGIRGPGDYVGEMSLFMQPGERSATIRARTDGVVLEMKHSDFEGLLRKHPSVPYELLRAMSSRLRESDEAMIRDLRAKNEQIEQAYRELKAAQEQLIAMELLEHELRVARSIQQSLLPHSVPSIEGFDIDARMLPARAVGGDCFDFIELSPNHLGIVIGDACDKGMAAAIFIAQTRSLLRAEAVRGLNPREVLHRVNSHLRSMSNTDMFSTAIFGILHTQTHTFHYARAGHPQPIICDAKGEITIPPRSPGQPLGIWDEPQFDEQIIEIPAGATVLLYTDGLTDAANQHREMFGMPRLRYALSQHIAHTARDQCDNIMYAINTFCGPTPQSDDITMVAIHSEAPDE
jgi:sigma-B regulation protein RsbU (phosphoserine phosphatase)